MMLRTVANLLASAVIACAQATSPPSFEVASIKPTNPSDLANPSRLMGGPGTNSPGQGTWTNVPLRTLILMAYDVLPAQSNLVSGLPSQDRDKYDVVAKVPAGATREQFRLMCQSLLAERFGLVVHWEPKDLPGYDLVVAKDGSKLREAEKPPGTAPPEDPAGPRKALAFGWPADKDGWPVFPPGIPRIGLYGTRGTAMAHLTARMQPVGGDLLRILKELLDRPVVDKTGLAGSFDFTLDFLPPNALPNTAIPEPSSGQGGVLEGLRDPAPDLFVALERQLGLKLVSTKSQAKVLVVDKVSDKPTEN